MTEGYLQYRARLHWNENPVAPQVWMSQPGIQTLQNMQSRDPATAGPAVVEKPKAWLKAQV
jgi:hypothetical protein